MLFLIPFTVCAFLALIVDNANGGITTFLPISRSCSMDDVCLTLGTLSRSQVRLEKTMKYGTDDDSKFSITAVVQCTSLVKSPPPNQHYKMAALDLQSGILCRALDQAIDASQAYTVSAEILNQAGWKGVNSGHPGLLFNAVDENNFDFVYLRPHSTSGCYQTGYMSGGKPNFVESKACPNGPPKGGVWFPFSVTVNDQTARVYHSGVLVATFKPHFASRSRGGVLIFHGYKNVILFRKFQTARQLSFTKRCKEVVEFPGYIKMDASNGSWPQDAFCQVAFESDGRNTTYEITADLYNFIGRNSVNFGHLGLFFNAEDEDNYDFVYFRLHNAGRCFQTGYLFKGQPKFDGAKSSSCPTGPPKGAEWFTAKVVVSNATPAGEVKVYLKGTLVTSFNPRYPIKKHGGVLVANGYTNVIYYRNFKIL
ncbi:uncharacterized skeletal organic matrix protein 7-like isoform X2 [Montipora foliosa]|uniref:uncharacterized skeletal organic matrix protein 7-like isoform X2 n=1 Tax=Montipora foliosa TaxID=591990 RepID=UPI0035F1B5A0